MIWKVVAEGGCRSKACRVLGGVSGWSLRAEPATGFAAAVGCAATGVFSPFLSCPHPRSWVCPLRH